MGNFKERGKLDKCATDMLATILECIQELDKKKPRYASAIISAVHSNGMVDVYLPPDKTKIFTNISNQTPFRLEVGDSVELMLKDGTFSNCWIAVKHGDSFKGE